MKIITNKTISSFLNHLSKDPVSLAIKIEKIDIVIQFTSWLVDSKQLSPNDGIRFRNELYKKKRDLTPKEAPKQSFPLNYVGFSLAALSLLLVLGGLYIRFFRDTKTPFAYSTAPVQAGRNISFQGRLTDSLGNPISAPIDISYSFYTLSSGGSPISSSTRVCTASPDQDGVFSTLIGKDAGGSGGTACNVEIPNSIFTENTDVYLGVTVGGGSEMTPRQQIANVGYAINSETLQGMPPGQSVSNIPFINQNGDMLIAAANTGIRSTFASSTFTISSGLATTIQSGTGDITLTATNGGSLRFKTYSSPGNTLERMTIMPTTGRVGIGTTAPRALFDVAGDATVSGSLIAGGQIKIGEFAAAPTSLGNGSTYYDSNTNKIYYWNGTAWTDLASGASQYWQRTLGSIAPTNITDDVNIGAMATGSAMVHLPGLVNKDAWFNLGTGKVGVGDVTPLSLFTVGNGDLFQVDSTGRIVALDGVAHTLDDVSGNLTLTSNSNTISLNDNVTFAGTTTLNSQAYTWPGTITNGYVLQTNGTGTLSWVDPIGLVGGANLWSLANGTLYPVNTTLDLFVGGTATTSAKFAFINSNSGTPTASISGTTANVRTFVDGNGNISTTNRTSLVLGNSATYNSTGNILLNPNGTGNVGIGTTSPSNPFQVYSLGVNSSSQIVPGAAAGSTDVSSGLWRVSTLFTGNNNQVLTIQGSRTQTTVGSAIDIPPTFAPTSGSVAWGAINLNPTVNQTGGANGATRGVYINPTLTSATSFRGIEIANNAGYGIYQSGASANNYFAGNIGIGSTTPTATLDVVGDASLSGHLVLRGTTPNYIHVLNGTDLRISNSPGGDTGSVDRLTMLANGNIGIGVTSPGQKLDVTQNILFGSDSGVDTRTNATAKYGKLLIPHYTNAEEAIVQLFSYSNATDNIIAYGGGSGVQNAATKLSFYTGATTTTLSGTEQMTINSAGNIGMGTITPTVKLDVVGDASASGNITIGQNSALRSQYGPLNLAYKSGLNTWTTGMVLQDTTGNVGVGTTIPSAKFEIFGSGTGATVATDIDTESAIRIKGKSTSGVSTWIGALTTDTQYIQVGSYNGSSLNDLALNPFGGNVGIGDTSPLALFTVGNGDLFQVDSTGRIVALDGVAHTIDDVTGNLTLSSNSTTISLNDNVTFAGTTTLNSLAYTWPGAQTTGYVLQTDGSGTLTWADPSVLTGGSNLWTSANGSLYPKNATLDLFVGGTASNSAKFAFINANAGTPTASISGTTANVRTFVDGNGNISTTNRTSLTLGNSTTYNSTGNILLNPNGTGNVGIGTTSPGWLLHVNGVTRSTQFSANLGSESSASYMLGTGGDTGIFSPSSSIIGFTTNATEKMRIDSTGSVGIGTITPGQKLDVAGNATISGNLMAGGQLQVGRFGYAPTSVGAGSIYFNTTNNTPYYSDGSGWSPFSTGSTNYWSLTNGSLYPVNSTLDAFIGGTASVSAKFAFLNVNAGTPTASISGTTANVRTFVDGNGNISTTNRTSLVLGNSATYNSTGNILLNPNGTGNVGIGVTSPTYKLDVSGDINLTGAVRSNGNAGLTGYVLTSSGGGLNTWTDVTSLTGGSNVWTIANGSIYPVNSTLDAFIGGTASVSAKFAFLNVSGGTPTASVSGTTANVNTYLTGNGNLATTNMAPLLLGGLTTGSIQLSPKNATGLFVEGTGNVGIGTANPNYNLQISKTRTGNDTLIALTTTGTGVVGDSSNILFRMPGTGGVTRDMAQISTIMSPSGVGALAFSTANTGVLSEQMRILNNGSVGIGTTSPLATFDIRGNSGTTPIASISGNTAMSSLIVDQSGSGDIFTASSSGMPRLVITNNGNVGIGDTTPLAALTVGNNDLFQVDYAGRIVSIDGVGHTIDDLAGNLIITSASNLINLNSNITFAGTTTLNSLTYTWPGTQTTGSILQTNGSGTLSWIDPSTLPGLWTLANGSLYPVNATLDVFIGGTASNSAKFAFLNANAGTPTASISGTTANVRTFMDGNGNISTTNRTSLVLGNSATYNSTGNILLNPNGTGNVGIGTTLPTNKFEVALASNQIALLGTAGVASGVSFTNGSILSQASQLQIVGNSTTPIAFYTGGTFDTMTAGTERVRINSTGSMGIGTTNPLATLDVRKNSGTTPVASVSGATSMSTLVVDQSGTGDILTASSSGNPRFVVKNNGNVGIGLVNPTYKLDVNGTVRGDIFTDTVGGGSYYVDPSGDSVFGGGLSLVGGLTGNSASLSGSLTIGNTQMIKSEWGNLNFGYKDTLNTWATGMVLQDTTGNVGIGTTNPLAKLHVYDSTVLGSVAGNTELNSQFAGSVGSNVFMHNEWLYRDSNGSDWLTARLHDGISIDNTYLTPGTNTRTWWERDPYNNIQSWGDQASTYLTINAGKIGIGTLSPLATLDVRSISGTIPVASISGNTSMAALIVDQSGSGDIFTASSSGEPRFVVKSNGNVGIGVANPTGKLSIAGSSSTISNVSGDITFNAASGNISFSNNNLINVANIASIGQIQIGGFASAPTSIGNGSMYYDTTSNRVFYWDGSIWSEMGSKYWQRTLGSMAPQYITDAINLGNTATGSALVHLPGTNNQDAWFYLGTGAVGIGTRTPSNTYKLDVAGEMRADKYVDAASAAYYLDPAGSSVLGGLLTNQGDIKLIDGSPEITSWDGANYNQITIRGSGDTTSTSLCVDEGTGTACDGKINAGTIDPPYTINGKKYATYLPSMTGVKEETTGKVLVTERNEEAKAYIKRIALGDQTEGSDLWLFGKTTNIKEQIKDMTVLLSSNTNGKVWYTVDQNNLVLTFYSSIPSEISYRLTAPRFDAGKFANRRNDNDYGTGFILNDQGNILAGAAPTYTAPKISVQAGIYSLIGNFVEEFTAANQALFANLTAGIINTQKIVSPIAEVDTLTATNKIQSKEINSELIKASNTIETPRLNTNTIDIGTKSGELAKLVINGLHNLPVVTIDAEGSATFAGTLTAQAVTSEQITTDNASVSGTLIANEIKSQTIDTLSSQIASTSSTLASSYQSLSGDINSVQQELAALKNTPLPNPAYYQNLDATYNSITVSDTANIYKAHIADSLVVGSLFVQKNSILALESNLTISSLNTITFFDGSIIIAKNGSITSKGQVSATSLAIKNVNGETVASIDSSGSARFNEVIAKKFTLDSIATQGAIIADSGIMNETNNPIPAIKTNAEVAGTGTVPQDTKEVIIYNDNVTADSLIYLTPTSNNVQGQLSVSKKVACPSDSNESQPISANLSCSPYFVISSSLLIHAETPFNWLIIN